jgi:hypothetical protein
LLPLKNQRSSCNKIRSKTSVKLLFEDLDLGSKSTLNLYKKSAVSKTNEVFYSFLNQALIAMASYIHSLFFFTYYDKATINMEYYCNFIFLNKVLTGRVSQHRTKIRTIHQTLLYQRFTERVVAVCCYWFAVWVIYTDY